MASIYEVFETDKALEKDGIIVDYGEAGKFRIRRMNNPQASEYFVKTMKRYKNQFDRGTMKDETAKEILLLTFVKFVLINWEGVKDRKGNELEFNEENAKILLTELPELFADLKAQAEDFTLFRREENEKIVKNSRKP